MHSEGGMHPTAMSAYFYAFYGEIKSTLGHAQIHLFMTKTDK